jgi:ABC-type phosphate/phosphonate transport system substrate-binding protein
VARVKEILLEMDQSEEGKKVLQAFEKTTKFDELSARALDPLLEATQFIDAEFGR